MVNTAIPPCPSPGSPRIYSNHTKWVKPRHFYLLTWNKGSWTFPPALSASGWAGWVHQRAELHTPRHRAPPPCSVGTKKENFQLSSKLPAGSLRVQAKPCHKKNYFLQKKREFRWKGGRCTLSGTCEPQIQLKIRAIFINLSLAQTKATLRQQPLRVKSCNILHLKPAKKPVGRSFHEQFRGLFNVSKRGNYGRELQLLIPGRMQWRIGSARGNVLAKKTAVPHSMGEPHQPGTALGLSKGKK